MLKAKATSKDRMSHDPALYIQKYSKMDLGRAPTLSTILVHLNHCKLPF